MTQEELQWIAVDKLNDVSFAHFSNIIIVYWFKKPQMNHMTFSPIIINI